MIWIFPVLVFLVVGALMYSAIFPNLGHTAWGDAHRSLNRLHRMVEPYREMHGSIPEAELANRIITNLWKERGEFDYKDYDSDKEDLAMFMA